MSSNQATRARLPLPFAGGSKFYATSLLAMERAPSSRPFDGASVERVAFWAGAARLRLAGTSLFPHLRESF
jgi:hypothetical protein